MQGHTVSIIVSLTKVERESRNLPGGYSLKVMADGDGVMMDTV
jgi:hypothetical protein